MLEHPAQNQSAVGGEAPKSYILVCNALTFPCGTLCLNTPPHVSRYLSLHVDIFIFGDTEHLDHWAMNIVL